MPDRPGHIVPAFDQALIEAGQQAGTQPVERRTPRPSLFDATAQNLFGDINLAAGGRRGDILGLLFGSILPPSKKQKAAFEQLKIERKQALGQARQGAVSEFAGAAGVTEQTTRTASLQVPGLAAGLEQTAQDRPGGRQALAGIVEQFPRQVAKRQLAVETAAATEQRRVAAEKRLVAAEDLKRARLGDPVSLENLTRAIATDTAAARLAGLPSPTAGQGVAFSPVTGQPQIVPLEGTEAHTAARRRLQGAQNALRLSARLAAGVEEAGPTGTDYFGTNAIRMASDRSQLMSAIFQSRGLGAPQGPDIELVSSGLPDPTSELSNLRALSMTPFVGINIPFMASMKQEFIVGFNQAGQEAEQTLIDIISEVPEMINLVDQTLLDPAGQLFGMIEQLRNTSLPAQD